MGAGELVLRRGRARAALVAALVGGCSAVMLAAGSTADRNDGNDTRGPLDIRRVERTGSERPRWTVITYDSWRVARMWDRGYVLVYLDTFGTTRYDYYALVRSKGNKLSGTLWRDRRSKDDVRIGFVESFRPSGRSVAVRVPLRRLNFPKDRLYYVWQARTLFAGPHCTQVCIDVVPNQGGVREPVPGATPEPTPTITPTITPTVTPTATPSPTVTP